MPALNSSAPNRTNAAGSDAHLHGTLRVPAALTRSCAVKLPLSANTQSGIHSPIPLHVIIGEYTVPSSHGVGGTGNETASTGSGMRKSLRLFSIAAVVLAVSVAALNWNRGPTAPTAYRASDLPSVVHTGRVAPGRIRILLRFPAVPTSDPLVWEYRPSLYGTLPPSIAFHFSVPPAAPFTVVEGDAPAMSYDLVRRRGDVPGFVVLTSCSVPR